MEKRLHRCSQDAAISSNMRQDSFSVCISSATETGEKIMTKSAQRIPGMHTADEVRLIDHIYRQLCDVSGREVNGRETSRLRNYACLLVRSCPYPDIVKRVARGPLVLWRFKSLRRRRQLFRQGEALNELAKSFGRPLRRRRKMESALECEVLDREALLERCALLMRAGVMPRTLANKAMRATFEQELAASKQALEVERAGQ
jgi:hypothetical protein